jgi:hypothetical protein
VKFGKEGASRSKNVLKKELQTTITDSVTRDGMGQDKTVCVNGKTVCYHLKFNKHPSFSKYDRFPLQFARDSVTYSNGKQVASE